MMPRQTPSVPALPASSHIEQPCIETGSVAFAGSGPGDPDLLTLKVYKALQVADVILFDRLVSAEILDLAHDDAILEDVGKEGFGPSMSQDEICARLVAHAQTGRKVLRLKSGDPTIFGRLDEEISACEDADVPYHIFPGITSASAAVAALGQSLTQRGRNSSVRFVTGHDVQGFADQDWAALAREGQVAAIYMGKKAARFVQGRLLMHGADPMTPVSVVENASRTTQRIVSTTLASLPTDLAAADLTGPALTFIGLAPRQSATALTTLTMELA